MSRSTRKLFTAGYEGLELHSFIQVLRRAGVQTVVDVRELPLSRKKGYSKTGFSASLAEHGIAYLHAPQLGCPKAIRARYQVDEDWSAYTKAFLTYLQTQQRVLRELGKLSSATNACLVCFEADFTRCHRTYVAREATKLGAPSVVHLTSRTAVPDLSRQAAA